MSVNGTTASAQLPWWRNGRRKARPRGAGFTLDPLADCIRLLSLAFTVKLILVASLLFGAKGEQQQQPFHRHHQQPETQIRAVNTPFGVVRGLLVRPVGVSLEGGPAPAVAQFLGIPYGSAPTAHHRFKMAISASKWTHQPKDAFQVPPACIQSGLSALSESEALKVTSAQRFDRMHRVLPSLKTQSEDCLFVNLFVPERDPRVSAQPLSVLVLVHGDTDYAWGGANAQNGTQLASLGQVVVVTLNYRLGTFGFLGRCESEVQSCAGNAGLSDLVAALKMLSLLLPSFGADPNAVTLLGWESGAALVSLLMSSPITQPKGRLFRRAILLDGSALAPWAMAQQPQQQFMRLAEELNVSNHQRKILTFLQCLNASSVDPFARDSLRLLHCLQEHGVKKLGDAARRVANSSPTFLSAFAPIVDGQIVPNQPRVSFGPRFGALFREIDLLLGTVVHPAQHLLADADIQHGIGVERRDKVLRTLVRNMFDYHHREIFEAILNEYTDWENPKSQPKQLRNGLLAALGDLLFTTPLVETARAHSLDENVDRTANTFFFVFAHETGRGALGSGLRGSLSGEHVAYILGEPLADDWGIMGSGASSPVGQFTAEDKELSRVMLTFVANFVKSGDPTRPQPMSPLSSLEHRFQGLPWPQFSAATREAYLEIAERPRVKNYYRNAFVQFWSGFVPALDRRGDKEVPEEHHLLPAHFDRASFFGVPRPFSGQHNTPFPPPPLPPTPFPKELRQNLISATTTKRPEPAAQPPKNGHSLVPSPSEGTATTHWATYNPSWGWLVLGGALTLVNLCIWVAISRKCLRQRSENKKKFQYQSYATTSDVMSPPPPASLDMNFATLMTGPHPQHRSSQQFLPPPPRPLCNNNVDHCFAAIENTMMEVAGNGGGFGLHAKANGGASVCRLVRRVPSGGSRNRSNTSPTKLATTPKKTSDGATTSTGTMSASTFRDELSQLEERRKSFTAGNVGKALRQPSGETGERSALHSRRTSAQEQEPLLSAPGSKSSTPAPAPPLVQIQPPGLIRLGPNTGISPTCPRHGRAAQMMLANAAAATATARTGNGGNQPLEEVQV